MINSKRVLAIVPARSGSKGLKGKNIKELCQKPLIAWPIEAAKSSKYIDKIIVSTDSAIIADVASKYGAQVPFIRPVSLAQDESTSIDVVEHALAFLKNANDHYDYLVLLEATSPLTDGHDIDSALEQLLNNKSEAKAIVGVTEVVDSHPAFCVELNEKGCITPYQKKYQSLRRQELSLLYRFEGSLYISEIETLLEKKAFYHDKTLPYIVPKWKSFEIDDITDFICVEAIMKNLALIADENQTLIKCEKHD